MTRMRGPDVPMDATDAELALEPRPAPELQQIVERYLHDRDPGAPGLVVARSTLEWARGALDDVDVDILVMGAHEAIRRDGAPAGTELGGSTVEALRAADLAALTSRKPYLDLPATELDDLLAVGLMELGRWQAGVSGTEGSVLPGVHVDRDVRAMTAADYRRWVYADRQGEGILDLMFGWLPGAVAGLAAGVVTALVTGDWMHLGVVALVAAIAGYVATGLGHRALEVADVAYLRLGYRLEHQAWGALYFGAGPLLALFAAALILGSA